MSIGYRPSRVLALGLAAIVIALALVSTCDRVGAQTPPQSPPQPSQAHSVGDSDAGAPIRRTEIEAIVKDYLAKHPEEVQRIVKDYLINDPQVLQHALGALLKRGSAAADMSAAIKANADTLFNSRHQVTLGNPLGDVTLVEFLDYNCGFCKRALADMLELINADPKLRVVLKEHPVLGLGSVEVARVAVAVRMQDGSGGRYLEFHRRLLTASGPANKARALAIAGEIGLDVARLVADMASKEADAALEETAKLARALGIRGSPSYVIGGNILFGAVGRAVLHERIAAARRS